MLTLRKLITEYIEFAFDPAQLQQQFHISAEELYTLADQDLLEIYDTALLTPWDAAQFYDSQ